jgi:formylglycine-generating enzyme required for sulfatase activity
MTIIRYYFIHKKLIINGLSIILFFALVSKSQAQCFEKFSKEGDAARAKGEIKLAIEKWERAKKCSDKPANNVLDTKIADAKKRLQTPPAAPPPTIKPPKPNKPQASTQTEQNGNTTQREQVLRDESAWEITAKIDKIEAYAQYLNDFPSGKYRYSAKRKIEQLTPPSQRVDEVVIVTETDAARNDFTMISIKGGSFMMGNDNSRYDDEKPAHEVRLNDFYMSKNEVTIEQWKKIMKTLPNGLDAKECGDCPIHNVSWTDAQGFIAELNKQTSKKYRLPTEAEWEYAAKGGNLSKKFTYSGGNDAKLIGWFSENSNAKPNSVAKKVPNELGLYDMTGNVREWCNDIYDENYYKNANSNDPKGATTGSTRVFRGGDFNDNSDDLSLTIRGSLADNFLDKNLGFRLVLDAK